MRRFSRAKNDITDFFETSDSKVFTPEILAHVLNIKRVHWHLGATLTAKNFINSLLTYTNLIKHELQFPNRQIVRYSWGETSVFPLALSIKKGAYFTHYTALSLCNLTDQIPKTIYVSAERPKKINDKTRLTQEDIDKALSKPQRVSKNIATYGDYEICLLESGFTDTLGVVEIETLEGDSLFITDLERTLIDITIRPIYAGGVSEILSVFRQAKGVVSINKLTAMLKKLEFTYPYHQAIGFYLERAGVYSKPQIGLLKKFDFEFDFYLTYGMKEFEYSSEWKIYYPKGF